MSTTVKTEIRPSYFYARFDGQFDFVQSIDRLPQILTEFAQSKRRQILMDVRGVEGEVTIPERMDYYFNFARLLRDMERMNSIKNPRVAWMVPPHWIGTGPGGELVERAGYDYFRSDDVELVLKWLGLPNNEKLG